MRKQPWDGVAFVELPRKRRIESEWLDTYLIPHPSAGRIDSRITGRLATSIDADDPRRATKRPHAAGRRGSSIGQSMWGKPPSHPRGAIQVAGSPASAHRAIVGGQQCGEATSGMPVAVRCVPYRGALVAVSIAGLVR